MTQIEIYNDEIRDLLSINTLRYAARTRTIMNSVVRNVVCEPLTPA